MHCPVLQSAVGGAQPARAAGAERLAAPAHAARRPRAPHCAALGPVQQRAAAALPVGIHLANFSVSTSSYSI